MYFTVSARDPLYKASGLTSVTTGPGGTVCAAATKPGDDAAEVSPTWKGNRVEIGLCTSRTVKTEDEFWFGGNESWYCRCSQGGGAGTVWLTSPLFLVGMMLPCALFKITCFLNVLTVWWHIQRKAMTPLCDVFFLLAARPPLCVECCSRERAVVPRTVWPSLYGYPH